MLLRFYNTLSRKKEIFKPLKGKRVGLYACGPTVYWFAHIGNLRAYIFEDVLRRVLEYNGYKVKHVMNITDVGHLTSDADTGEDKMEKGAKREGKSAWDIAKFYTNAFKKDLKKLNIKDPDVWIKATDTIKEQIELIQLLEKKGYTYKIEDGIYFNTSKLKKYGRLWPKKMSLKKGARVEMVPGKKNPTDFALWKFSPPGIKRQMEWNSPWGKGFPGWHTECVVMATKELGIPFDIHCGGIDHILIHHTNEIAQAEAAFGEIPAKYWLHSEFLTLKEGKMAKSKRNIVILEDIVKKGLNPLAYRYLCLTAHYRSKLKFSWDILKQEENALKNLYQKIEEIKEERKKDKTRGNKTLEKKYKKDFLDFINDDLNIPKALALAWELIKDKRLNLDQKHFLLLDFDRVFGLNLDKVKKEKIPLKIKKLMEKREKYRQEKNWKKADQIREKVKKMGFLIEDTKEGPEIKRL